jgi:hypothetical protein
VVRRVQVATFELVLGAFLALFVLESADESLRYIKYGLPVVAAMLVAGLAPPITEIWAEIRRHFGELFGVVAAVLAVALLYALARGSVNERFAEEAYFLLAPLALAYLVLPYLDPTRIESYARAAFMVVIGAYLVESGGELLELARAPSGFVTNFLLSTGGAESGTSFVFGLFVIYFAASRRWRWTAVAFAFTVLSFKRIAVLGAVVGIAALVAARATGFEPAKHRRAVAIGGVIANAVVLIVLYLLARGVLDDLVLDYTGLPANWVTMGRAGMYAEMFDHGGISIAGRGLGDLTTFLYASGYDVGNAHSDVIKYVLELGPVLSAILMYRFYRSSSRTLELLVLLGFLDVLFITDNVSIYFRVMFVFYLIQACMLARADRAVSRSYAPAPITHAISP